MNENTETILIRLPADLKAAIIQAADASKVSRSQFIRDSLIDRLTKYNRADQAINLIRKVIKSHDGDSQKTSKNSMHNNAPTKNEE